MILPISVTIIAIACICNSIAIINLSRAFRAQKDHTCKTPTT